MQLFCKSWWLFVVIVSHFLWNWDQQRNSEKNTKEKVYAKVEEEWNFKSNNLECDQITPALTTAAATEAHLATYLLPEPPDWSAAARRPRARKVWAAWRL